MIAVDRSSVSSDPGHPETGLYQRRPFAEKIVFDLNLSSGISTQ
jgi:hypothetical protein